MNVIDLFSGAGGFSSGLTKSGFNIVLANEFNPEIANTYQLNHKNTLMINADIRDFVEHYDEYIEKSLNDSTNIDESKFKQDIQNIDLVVGGPPCQGFSMAGARIRKDHQLIEDPRNFLFKYYFKVIQKYEPQYFILENVPGFITMHNGNVLKEVIKIFTDESNFKNRSLSFRLCSIIRF